MMVCCFFKEEATTEIYTYGQTLALHDSLPIWWLTSAWGQDRRTSRRGQRTCRRPSRSGCGSPRRAVRAAQPHARGARTRGAGPPADRRSEEHTSELQSLMRTSYADICLQNIINQHHTQYLSIHTYVIPP